MVSLMVVAKLSYSPDEPVPFVSRTREFLKADPVGRLLVVDDLLSVRLLLRAILTGAGHTVVAEATNGREAVSLYHLFHPDAVMMDITMPEQDGLAAMEEIMKVNPEAQIIVCTALGFKWVAADALKRGASDFLVKPFRPDGVLQAVRAALHRVQLLAAQIEPEPAAPRPAFAAGTEAQAKLALIRRTRKPYRARR